MDAVSSLELPFEKEPVSEVGRDRLSQVGLLSVGIFDLSLRRGRAQARTERRSAGGCGPRLEGGLADGFRWGEGERL